MVTLETCQEGWHATLEFCRRVAAPVCWETMSPMLPQPKKDLLAIAQAKVARMKEEAYTARRNTLKLRETQ